MDVFKLYCMNNFDFFRGKGWSNFIVHLETMHNVNWTTFLIISRKNIFAWKFKIKRAKTISWKLSNFALNVTVFLLKWFISKTFYLLKFWPLITEAMEWKTCQFDTQNISVLGIKICAFLCKWGHFNLLNHF